MPPRKRRLMAQTAAQQIRKKQKAKLPRIKKPKVGRSKDGIPYKRIPRWNTNF